MADDEPPARDRVGLRLPAPLAPGVRDLPRRAGGPLALPVTAGLHTERNRGFGYGPLIELATQPGVVRWPGAHKKFDKISQLVQAELDLVWLGEKTAQQAAEDVCPKVDEELARE